MGADGWQCQHQQCCLSKAGSIINFPDKKTCHHAGCGDNPWNGIKIEGLWVVDGTSGNCPTHGCAKFIQYPTLEFLRSSADSTGLWKILPIFRRRNPQYWSIISMWAGFILDNWWGKNYAG